MSQEDIEYKNMCRNTEMHGRWSVSGSNFVISCVWHRGERPKRIHPNATKPTHKQQFRKKLGTSWKCKEPVHKQTESLILWKNEIFHANETCVEFEGCGFHVCPLRGFGFLDFALLLFLGTFGNLKKYFSQSAFFCARYTHFCEADNFHR